MKLKIFSLLIAVLMSTAMLTACSKAPAGAESSDGSGESLSTEQGGEPSESESAAESGEKDLQRHEALLKELNERYLPLYGILINCEEWASPEEISVEMFYAWYTDYTIATMQLTDRKARYSGNGEPGWHYPAEEFEEFVQKYFDISSNTLRESDVYNENEGCYNAAGGWSENYAFSVASPEDISISGSTATAKLICVSNLDSSVIYFYLSLDISKEPYKFTSCSKAPAGAENSGGSSDNLSTEQVGEASASESGAESVRFSCSVAADKTVTCALSLPADIAFLPDSVGGEFSKDGEKIGEISILPESDGHEAWAKSIRSLEQKAIGEYEFYADSYETALVEEDEDGNKQLKKYIIYEYSLCDGDIWYSFTFLQRVSPQIVTLEECENILPTFQIEQS